MPGDFPYDVFLSHSTKDKAVVRALPWLKEQYPRFGGLVRVEDKRQEFLWVHPQFEKEY